MTKKVSNLRLMFKCRDAVPMFSRALDEPLPRGQRIALFMHRMMCGLCRRYNRQIHLIREMLRTSGPKTVDRDETATLSEPARTRIQDALDNANESIDSSRMR